MAKKRKLASSKTPEEEQQQQQRDQEEQASYEVYEEDADTGDPEVEEEGEDNPEVEEEGEDNPEVEEEGEDNEDEETETKEDAEGTSNPVSSTSNPTVDDDDTEEPVEKLLEPFNKEQLIDLLREAAETHSDLLDRIREVAGVDPVHRKIFVHGLGWDTNAEILINAFKQYGEIEDCNAVCDKITGKSKGYAFILFKHRSGARKALKQPQKRIGNRMTSCQLASAGPVQAAPPATPPASEYTQRKIYVSNVSADVDPHKLVTFFSKYGEIEEGPLGLDKQTGRPKGFTLFVYKTVESAKKALEEPHKNFEGHILHCQKAIDGPKPNKQFYHHQSQHHPQRGSHYQRSENPSFTGSMGNHGSAATPGHLMAPSPAGVPFNQAATQALNPALGQALTALLASQGAGLGLTNLLGSLGSTGVGATLNPTATPMVNNTSHGMQGMYGNQPVASNISPGVMGVYGNQPSVQSGYSNVSMGQAGAGRQFQGHMGGGAPYMGH